MWFFHFFGYSIIKKLPIGRYAADTWRSLIIQLWTIVKNRIIFAWYSKYQLFDNLINSCVFLPKTFVLYADLVIIANWFFYWYWRMFLYLMSIPKDLSSSSSCHSGEENMNNIIYWHRDSGFSSWVDNNFCFFFFFLHVAWSKFLLS